MFTILKRCRFVIVNYVIDEYLRSETAAESIEDGLSAGIIVLPNVLFAFFQALLALLFIPKCDLSGVALILPVCDESSQSHTTFLLMPLLILIQLIVHNAIVQILIPFWMVAVIWLVVTHRVLVEMG